MLTSLEVLGVAATALSPMPALLSMPLGDGTADTNSLQITDIDGVGPVKAAVTTNPYGLTDGESLVGSSTGKRNIVLTIRLNPDWATQTMAELRSQLYRYFMPKQQVLLRFHSTHLPTCQIEGVVESADPAIFSREPEMVVSILCPKPDFVAEASTVVTGVTLANGSGFGGVIPIEYDGTVNTGMRLDVTKSAAAASFGTTLGVYFRSAGVTLVPLGFLVGLTSYQIDADYFVRVNSVPGAKQVRRIETIGGDGISLLDRIGASSNIWPTLVPGLNLFYVTTTPGGADWTMTYNERFGGL